MEKTLLELYKSNWQHDHDGETVLRAAERGFFPKNHEEDSPISTSVFLSELGIEPEMNRDEILILLASRMGEDNFFLQIVEREAKNRTPIKLVDSKESDQKADFNQIYRGVREKAFRILGSVLHFCESAGFDDGEPESQITTETPKKGFLSLLKGVLK